MTQVRQRSGGFGGALAQVALCVGGVGLGFAATYALGARQGQLPVSASVTSLDFGVIEDGSVVEKSVRLRNNLDTPFRFDSISASCGCTTLNPVGVIAPHSTVSLTVRYDSSGRAGAIQQAVTLRRGARTLTIPLTGTVARTYAVSPSEAILSEQGDAEVIIKRRDGKPLSVPRVETPPGVAAIVSPVSPDAARIQFRRTVAHDKQTVGAFHESANLVLSGDRPAVLRVPMSWSVPSRYKVTPALLNFGAVTPGATLARTVTVSGVNASGLRVTAAPKGWTAKIEPVGASKAMLTVSGKTGDSVVFQDAVVLATGDPTEPTLRLPIVAAPDIRSSAEACTVP